MDSTALICARAVRLAPRVGRRDRLNLRPKALENWLSRLPTANLDATGEALFTVLKQANQDPGVKSGQRLAFLEALRPAVLQSARRFRERYQPWQFPLSSASRRTNDFALALLRELAVGYERTIQAAEARPARSGRRQLPLVLERAIRCYSAMLLECYYVYRPAPAGVWQRLHELYLTARGRDLEAIAITEPELRYRHRCSVAESYRQVLLLAAAAPQRLRHQELDELFHALEPAAATTVLEPAVTAPAGEAIFRVRLDRDEPPRRVCRPSRPNRLTYQFNCQTAKDAANRQSQVGQSVPHWRGSRERPSPSERLRARVATVLASRPRRFARQGGCGAVRAMLGLANIGRMLASYVDFAPPSAAEAVEGITVTSYGRDVCCEYHERTGWQVVSRGSDTSRQVVRAVGTHGLQYHCEAVNFSASGYRLMLPAGQTAPVRLGQLIALEEIDRRGKGGWQLGIVRWLRHGVDGRLQLGVELLAANPLPVLLEPEFVEHHEGVRSYALLVPAMPSLKQPTRIFTPPLPYIPGAKARITGTQGSYRIILTRELEASGSVKAFEFESLSRSQGPLAE